MPERHGRRSGVARVRDVEARTFGEVLKHERLAAGLTQEELAERASLSARAISDLERGVKQTPRRQTMELLADALRLSPGRRDALRAAAHPGRSPAAVPELSNGLPMPLTSLVGRDRETASAQTLLRQAEVRLLTLTGPGGVGKTRLGLDVADNVQDEFADGVLFVPLAALDDPALLVPTVARLLGVADSGSRSPAERLRDHLRTRHVLLILDNLEHLLGAVAAVADLLTACPRLKVLATSRAPLRVRGEREFPVPPLSLPDRVNLPALAELAQVSSIRLFCERACDVQPYFELTSSNAAVVAEICHRLDGLPLGLELAAALLKLFTPQALLARLERRFAVLTAGPRDVPAHQQTLRSTIAWSYGLLAPADQSLFRSLAVLARGFDLAAAEAVGSAPYRPQLEIVEGVGALVDQSLVAPELGSDGETRFGMLETIREFGWEQLDASGELAGAQRRHAGHFAEVAEALETGFASVGRDPHVRRFRADHDNLRVALDWSVRTGEAEIGLRLVGALWSCWAWGHISEGRHWAEAILFLPGAGQPTRARARALTTAGIMAVLRNDPGAACQLLEESVAIWRTLDANGRDFGLALALTHLGISLQGPNAIAADCLVEEALALFREVDNRYWTSVALRHLGIVAEGAGDLARARMRYSESLALARKLADPRGLGQALSNLGRLALREDDLASASAALEESLTLFRQIGDGRNTAVVLESLGRLVVQREPGKEQASTLFAESLVLFRQSDDLSGVAACLEGLAALAAVCGQLERAAYLFGAADAGWAASTPSPTLGAYPLHRTKSASLRGVMSQSTMGAAWAAGSALPLEQAVDLALDGGRATDHQRSST